MEGEASLPLLPLKHLYTCSTCVCAGCSMAVCPFCHTCHKMLFPLLLEGILFRGELCCALLFLSCLKSIAEEVTEINLDILVLNFLDLDLQNHFNHTIAVTSLHNLLFLESVDRFEFRGLWPEIQAIERPLFCQKNDDFRGRSIAHISGWGTPNSNWSKDSKNLVF